MSLGKQGGAGKCGLVAPKTGKKRGMEEGKERKEGKRKSGKKRNEGIEGQREERKDRKGREGAERKEEVVGWKVGWEGKGR